MTLCQCLRPSILSFTLTDAAPVEEKQPIVEEMMTSQTAVVTGDTDNPNPEFTAALDKTADAPTEGEGHMHFGRHNFS